MPSRTAQVAALLGGLAVASARPSSAPEPPGNRGAPILGSTFRLVGDQAVGDKAHLTLDPLDYRSSSQGPIMPAELEPASAEQYDEIDTVIERATRTSGWAPIIPQYKRGTQWAWQQWEYTIVQRLWKTACQAMLVPLGLLLCTHFTTHTGVTKWWRLSKEHALYEPLMAIAAAWNYLLPFATFVTTFFVGHSHEFWRKSYSMSRSVQGRLNDLGLICGSHARRMPEGGPAIESVQFLSDTARNLRLLHCLFYADLCYRKQVRRDTPTAIASIRLLLAFDRVNRVAPGLTRLRARGLVTDREYETLVSLALPPSRWYLVVLEWVTARIAAAHKKGILTGGDGFEKLALEKCCDLRSACMTIPDELAARMPLAYVHFAHCLVDILLLIAPFGLYANLGCFAIPMTGLFALFYRGLLELSKSFLDPFGNRRVSISGLSADISIDCLLGESNAGSIVWPQGAQVFPWEQKLPSDTNAGPIPITPYS